MNTSNIGIIQAQLIDNIMHSQDLCFTNFNNLLDDYSLPERFTFPFYYQPHPICVIASEQLQKHLESQKSWHHDFSSGGKMFGVLLVTNSEDQLGYLSAFSGKLADKSILPHFVPPVFDTDAKWDAEIEFEIPEGESHFAREKIIINQINSEIARLQNNPNIEKYQHDLAHITRQTEQDISSVQLAMSAQRKVRKNLRNASEKSLEAKEITETEHNALKDALALESVADKNKLKYLKLTYLDTVKTAQRKLDDLLDVISALKAKRKQMSAGLQEQIFQQYRFLNITGVEKNLTDLFQDTAFHHKYGVPPAGSGDCAAPKLLQYAFKNNLTPLAMAEFWWGQSPKSEMKQHKNFYTACLGKCQPILAHMLSDMDIDDNPLLTSAGADKALEIIYQDDHMVIVNKPDDLLSVPGKSIQDSVYHRMQALFPSATGSLIVHRLDMSTSGLMVIALTKAAHKNIQQQFIKRTVEKRYVALLEGKLPRKELSKEELSRKKLSDKAMLQGKELEQTQGKITLPLAGDFDDRPKQLVCFEHGKPAETTWHLAGETHGKTRVHLYPKTGRTHQLRVHCAHQKGLNMPILGDDLYGSKAERLHLHADTLIINHPETKERLTFQVDADF
jgi:tRNA pseudouridine32 synthase/23S rRNA pseudouridine746 synthase